MKKLILIAVIIFSANILAFAQAKETVKIGENIQKSAMKKKLKIKFLKVIEDSRCPEGVDCVWAGVAKISVKATNKKGISKEIELSTDSGGEKATFDGYEINLKELLPKPKANDGGKRIYTATLEIMKAKK